MLSFPLGVTIGYFITIVVSFAVDNGRYCPCVPALADALGSELSAVVAQALCTGLIGAAFGGGTVAFEMDSWSLAKQSAVYFVVCALVITPVSYAMNWVERSVAGALIYFGGFALVWLLVWFVQYQTLRGKIRKLNAGVDKLRS